MIKYKNHKTKEKPHFMEIVHSLYYNGWRYTVIYYNISNYTLQKWLRLYGFTSVNASCVNEISPDVLNDMRDATPEISVLFPLPRTSHDVL